jgi:hypothetical protein
LILLSAINLPSFSGQITDLEWTIYGTLNVTYAHGSPSKMIKIDCTAYNENKLPIGGGCRKNNKA